MRNTCGLLCILPHIIYKILIILCEMHVFDSKLTRPSVLSHPVYVVIIAVCTSMSYMALSVVFRCRLMQHNAQVTNR